MKKIFFALLLLQLGAFGQGKKKFTINGKYGAFNAPAKAYLEYELDSKTILDSVVLKDGNFKFSGKAPVSPVEAALIFDTKGMGKRKSFEQATVYLEPGNIRFVSDGKSTLGAQITGTPANNDYTDFNNLVDAAFAKMNPEDRKFLEGKISPENTPDFEAQLAGFKKRYSDLTLDAYVQFIQSHPGARLSLDLLPKVAYDHDYTMVKPLFDGLSDKVKASAEGVKFAESLERMKNTGIGRTAPDFELPDTTGNMVKLSSFLGKYVLLDFWASWCGPCRAENPNLVKIYQQFSTQNFTIVGVSLDRPGSRAAWLSAIKKDGLPWLQLSDLKCWDSPAAKLFGVQAIPQNFLIDPNGVIIGKTLMGKDLELKLQEIFKP